MNKIFFLTYFLILFVGNSFSQWQFSLGTTQSHSNNPFNSPLPTSSFISSIDLGVEREFTSLNFGYYGSNYIFHELPERNYYWHQFGLWSETDSTMFGVYLEQRFNSSDYNYYNYINYNTYYKQKFSFSGINLFGNAALSYTDYSVLNDLDNILALASIAVNKSFETKTTLLGGVNFNYKNYISTNLNDSRLSGDSLFSNSENAFTTQFNYFFRIAQSLSESTGLAIQYSKQNIIGGTAAYVRELDYFYGDESQFFDDPISYEGYSLFSQLTQILPMEFIIRLSYGYNYKEYPSHGVYLASDIIDDSEIRIDKQQFINASISKSFYWGEENDYQLILKINYYNVDNSSNSYWYHYESSAVDLGIDFQF